MTTITAYDYPPHPHVRRHGPYGYSTYEPFREWLRDEFSYRCVFCLQREQWSRLTASFHIDHFVPQAIDPTLACDYDNLLYVCASCNSIKSDSEVPNPCDVGFGECLVVHANGTIEAKNSNGELLIEELRLDDDKSTQYRQRWLDTWRALISSGNLGTYEEWMRYPEDLPDLNSKVPTGNSRPQGIVQSKFERRRRGELPSFY